MKLIAALTLACLLGGCASTPVQPPPTRAVKVSWQPVTTLTDGQPLTDLTGYQVSWYAPGGVLQQKQLSPATSTALTVTPGSWQFYVQAISKADGVGLKSQVVSKTVP